MTTPAKEINTGEMLTKYATQLGVRASSVLPFADQTDLISLLLSHLSGSLAVLTVAGHATPDLQIAADRAGMTTHEILGASPFVYHPEDLIEALSDTRALLYLANPNSVSGANHSAASLRRLVRGLPRTTIIMDEKYFPCHGISGLEMMEDHPNLVVLRSQAVGGGLSSDNSGFLIAHPDLIESLRHDINLGGGNRYERLTLHRALGAPEMVATRLAQIHDESVRLATFLTELEFQNRITVTDYLLLRVADPKQVGNYLARHRCPVENLDGYPQLKNYMRFRIGSPAQNDIFLTAVSRMPKEFYYLKDMDHRAVMLHRPSRAVTTPENENKTLATANK